MPEDEADGADVRPEIAGPVSSERETSDATGAELDRLPPPAFPPGSDRRRTSSPRASVPRDESGEGDEGVPFDAFISPDDPIRKEARGIPDDAFISPEDPLVHADRDESGKVSRPDAEEETSSTVTGPVRGPERPTIHELPYLLDQLAERIHTSGERALDVHPELGHFEAALRAFLRGYLKGSGGAD